MSNYYEMIIDDETKRVLEKLRSIKKTNQKIMFDSLDCELLDNYITKLEKENKSLRRNICDAEIFLKTDFESLTDENRVIEILRRK